MDIETARLKAIQYKLSGPDWALDMSIPISYIRARIGSEGGCGPGNSGDVFVPDSIVFINIKPICYVHDCRYSEVKTTDERFDADLELYVNGIRYLRKNSANRIMFYIRKRVLDFYFAGVDIGGSAFTEV